jgi:A/G-specific adenine glycosylase
LSDTTAAQSRRPRLSERARRSAHQDFAQRLVRWQRRNGRHDLPWQNSGDPYLIWVSEIMLQQTQVATVIPYFRQFIARFPDIATLARAAEDEVLSCWSGLGYYSRARNLHRSARIVVEAHAGRFPRDFDRIVALPGIGPSTAAAIAVFAFGQRQVILDGNVKRVLARFLGVAGYPGDPSVQAVLWRKAEALAPRRDIETYTQALMDLGATVCVRRQRACRSCPANRDCAALRAGRVSELPAPKPRRILPERRATLLILRHGGQVLLEKRPASGIWGGLWSLPELPAGADPVAVCAQRFGATVEPLAALPELRHSFSHFSLRITPQPLNVTALGLQACEPGCVWITREDAAGGAIPAPVRAILRSLK